MKNNFFVWLLSLTWGVIMTVIGAITAIFLMFRGYIPTRFGPSWVFVIGKNWGGISLGPVVLVSAAASVATIYHEVGHTIQNALYGIAFPFIVAIPSVIRYWYREWKKPSTPYDAIWFEGQATAWGIKYMDRQDK